MIIRFLGTGVAIPQKDRIQSGILLEDQMNFLLLDCGSGTLNRINDENIKHTSINKILLTHLHLDHVSDLLCLVKANHLCGLNELDLYGPTGTLQYIENMLNTYSYLKEKVKVNIKEIEAYEDFVITGTNFRIKAINGIHSVPSLIYRIESNQKTVVYTGDTEPNSSIIDFADGADCLIHECSFPSEFITTNHTKPDMLAQVLIEQKDINLSGIILTHLYPHMKGHEKEAIECLNNSFTGWIKIAEDKMVLEI
ncbi:MBL fold metallo-hydrolase [Methanosalsum natronophilum]|uniref:MBL fold metallo-hydrolase n=1 Tax=Methanosalsum natronophilum TaxID=768733 RepID=UPI002169555B|nr:MBL fold metallo-hydrolase [Methanosalsum natronophilum]MCS3924321.1 ribonuclease BN (tRNA processing enzyme) [Methanosalsum natronophilum]